MQLCLPWYWANPRKGRNHASHVPCYIYFSIEIPLKWSGKLLHYLSLYIYLTKPLFHIKFHVKLFQAALRLYSWLIFFSDLTVLVDKRITLGAFKGELEPHVGTTSDNFKVQVYSTHIPWFLFCLIIMNEVNNRT